jgi:nucleotide-binding universal stress UspA family protein
VVGPWTDADLVGIEEVEIMKRHEILVGVDGSPASQAALAWAAAEAARRGCELTVLYAYEWHMFGARAPIGSPLAEDARSRAGQVVAAAVNDAKAAAPTLTVHGQAVLGAPGPTLVAAAESAELVVVGSRGRGGFASLLLGSVSQQVATHTSGPVVVVRGRPEPVGPIVVGVDGSSAAQDALGLAFDAAGLRSARIVAVRVYTLPMTWGTEPGTFAEDREERRRFELEALLDDLAPWKEKYAETPIEAVVVESHAAGALIGLSHTAQLVVVGTRGHGGFAGLLLGSVGLQLLHHAECPVLIARARAAAR